MADTAGKNQRQLPIDDIRFRVDQD
jgi:hypothetical protein